MEYEVLKTFPFAADGVTVRTASVGELVRPSLGSIPGLIAGGFIRERETKALPGAPEVKAETPKRGRKPEAEADES